MPINYSTLHTTSQDGKHLARFLDALKLTISLAQELDESILVSKCIDDLEEINQLLSIFADIICEKVDN